MDNILNIDRFQIFLLSCAPVNLQHSDWSLEFFSGSAIDKFTECASEI